MSDAKADWRAQAQVEASLQARQALLVGIAPAEITLPLAMHILHDGPDGLISEANLQAQLERIQTAYAGCGLNVELSSVDFLDDPEAFHATSSELVALSDNLNVDPSTHLNVYTWDGESVLDASWGDRTDDQLETIAVNYTTLPGGVAPYGAGATLVGAAGRALGLSFVHTNDCRYPGDGVADTPYQRPSYTCEVKDSCPGGGTDTIHNYQSFTDDQCMSEVTAGQCRRMRDYIQTFLPGLL